jgi:hypothetical protein
VQSAFGVLIFVVVAVAAVIAVISLVNRGDLYEQIGRGGLSIDEESGRGGRRPAPTSAATSAEAEEEVRQMVAARNQRRLRQGRPELDVEAEVARLRGAGSAAGAAADPELVEEVRQLVQSRNARRARQGKPELDVEAEVARQLRELGG